MRYLYYPGCSAEATGKAYDISACAMMDRLGVELVELDDWNCCGAPEGVLDQGAKMLSTIASIIDAPTPEEIAEIAASVPDPVGTFYRFGLADSLLRRARV